MAFLLAAGAVAACGPALRPLAVSPELLRQEQETQRELTFKTNVDRQMRLQRIYTQLRLANADLCAPKLTVVTGMFGLDQHSLDSASRNYARNLYGVSDGVKLIDIPPGSPAAVAGLLPGDVITGAAKGVGVVPTGWTQSGLTIAHLVKVIESAKGDSMTILVRRGSAAVPFPLSLTPAMGCSFPIELNPSQIFNAGADGERIIMNSGAFNVLSDDRQIAFIVAHELSHNILEHVQKSQGNAAAGAAAGLIFDIGLAVVGINSGGLGARTGAGVGGKAYSKEFESEADYLGVYLLARAGFDLQPAQDTLRTMGVESPAAQVQMYATTHPSTPERAAAMGESIAEIRNKIASQQTLMPSVLPGQSLRQSTALTPVSQIQAQPPASAPAAAASPIPAVAAPIASGTSSLTTPAPAIPTASTQISRTSGRSLAYLYLVKGRIVSNPPQSFTAAFVQETGAASATLSGNRRVDGSFELFEMSESISSKYKARLLKPDSIKPFAGADAKGFASLSDRGLTLECAFAITRATGKGEGSCADTEGNFY